MSPLNSIFVSMRFTVDPVRFRNCLSRMGWHRYCKSGMTSTVRERHLFTTHSSIARTSLAAAITLAAVTFGSNAHATLILDTAITGGFGTPSTSTTHNDFSGLPATVYFGQLAATHAGNVEFFYLGNEAGYTNRLLFGAASHSTAGLADTFSLPGVSVGSVAVAAGAFVDFGFCTSGGSSVPGASTGYCAHNDDTASLLAQFNHGGILGYRSIAYLPLTGLSPFGYASAPVPEQTTASNYWMILWDDSGAANDDDHDDYIAVARFTPTVSVPEPATLSLLAAGLLGVGFTRRRRAAAA
jgi:hypothetical protein